MSALPKYIAKEVMKYVYDEVKGFWFNDVKDVLKTVRNVSLSAIGLSVAGYYLIHKVMCVHHAKCLCCSRDAKNGVMCCGDVCGTNQCQYRNPNGERCKKPCRDNPRNVMCVDHAG